MVRLLQSPVRAYLLCVAAAAVVPAAVLHFLLGQDGEPVSATAHVVLMGVGSTVAAVASVGLLAAGARARDGRAVVAGGAFAVMTLLLLFHGIAIPGVLFSRNGVVALAGASALPVGGALLTLAALPWVRDARHVGRLVAGFGVLLVVIAALGVLALTTPSIVPRVPRAGDPLAVALAIVGATLYLTVAWRATRTFLLTRRAVDLCVTVGVVWLGCALVPQLLVAPGGWAFWLGHVLELAGLALVGLPLIGDARRARPSRPVVGDLAPADLVAHEEAFLGARVRALVTRLERKDGSTEQHTRRVAQWAVWIGEELRESPANLRDLAIAGLLHDIGKLSVPTAILTKPGALTDEEFAAVRMHPVSGDELLAELGYQHRIRRVVRGHHERIDGSGYPDGLAGAEIDFMTRILAVADVYDALVSPRVYRTAWDRDRALAYLTERAGAEFDARCVAALVRLVAAKPPHALDAAA